MFFHLYLLIGSFLFLFPSSFICIYFGGFIIYYIFIFLYMIWLVIFYVLYLYMLLFCILYIIYYVLSSISLQCHSFQNPNSIIWLSVHNKMYILSCMFMTHSSQFCFSFQIIYNHSYTCAHRHKDLSTLFCFVLFLYFFNSPPWYQSLAFIFTYSLFLYFLFSSNPPHSL